MTRSDFLRGALLAPLTAADLLSELRRSKPRILADPPEGLSLEMRWSGNRCRPVLKHTGRYPSRIKEVILASATHQLPDDTPIYGESFQMLSQTVGTLGRPEQLGYSERKHYRLPQPEDAYLVTGMLTLSPTGGQPLLLAFNSCHRFQGRFYLRPGSIEVSIDTENRELRPGEEWPLEEFEMSAGKDRPELLTALAARISTHHPPLKVASPPTGWCSWYCFGPRVTAGQVLSNLDFIAKAAPQLKYVQIDDGYQPAMGDWLETGSAFGGDIRGVLKAIRTRGFEPAIWVAPFIAEAGSHLFTQHPDWFVKDAAGQPLSSNQVTFGGWRRGPWFALDGTHPEAQKHLEALFREMRQTWGCSYFKLDANFWGAIHGGYFHDPRATRIEAYRRGMQAVRRGSGDGFLLGCNHPIWASFGLIHGSRSSGDISRKWNVIRTLARENLSRNWQNGRLWWNDPDAVVLTGDLPENEFLFHATSVYASGGMVLSGDDLTKMPPARLAMLKKLLPPAAQAARFADNSLTVGWMPNAVAVFNWEEQPTTIAVPLPHPATLTDFWTGASLGVHRGVYTVRDLPAHSARLLTVTRA